MRLKSDIAVIGVVIAMILASVRVYRPAVAIGSGQTGGPYSSQPLALNWDDSELAIVNPDTNTVSIFLVPGDRNTKAAEITVGKEPWGAAFSPDGTRLYVANRVDGTVSIVSQGTQYYGGWGVSGTIPVGTEPFGMVLSNTGRKLYVTNTGSNSVSVIDISTNQVITTIPNVGPLPRGIAITHGPTLAESDQVVYVTDFLALPARNGELDGFDDSKVGVVTAISVGTDKVIGTIKLQPMADTGLKAAGDVLHHIAPPANPAPADFKFTTGAYPNELNSIVTNGNLAYIPSTAASPNGPVRFNVNLQSLVSLIDLTKNVDAGQTINIQAAVNVQTNPTKLFVTQPWAIAFKNSGGAAYIASAASNIMVKLTVDPTTGKPTVQNDLSDSTRVFEIPVGKNPRGIVINSSDTRAYVMNYISRDVTVIDLTQSREQVLATLPSTALPQPGTLQDKILIGKELFNTSVGVFDPPAAGQPAVTGRMSNNGWASCAGCHPEGLSDNTVWIFASGPRRTVPLHATFAPGDPSQQRALNWSAIFDQIEDFEGNIRNVSGGLGIFVQSDGITQAALPAQFSASLAGRQQLTVRGVGGWDAIKAYIQSGIRAPLSPASKQDPDVVAGQQLFIQASCQSCHGSSQWTTSRVRYTPPPDPKLVVNTELINELFQAGTFSATAANEVRATAAPPLGPDGFNPPSLLSIFAFPQTFFHNGSAAALDDVLTNVAHRTAGSGGTDYLTSSSSRAQLVKFLLSIDANTPPVPVTAVLPAISSGGIVNAASFAKTVAPGSIASVFGTAIASSRQSAASVPLSTSLGGASLAVAGMPATFFFASPNQINVQIPWEAQPGATSASLTVGANSSAASVNVAQYAPGIFTTGSAQGIVVGPSGGLAAPGGAFTGSQPVTAGDFITIYCTGLGPVTNQPASGAAADSDPLPSTTVPASVTIGGVTAAVSYAGLTPGAVGLYQVNAQVPPGVASGDSVPLTMSIGGATSNTVMLAIR
jgi:uncharacterized protein (TIGR03437 family)